VQPTRKRSTVDNRTSELGRPPACAAGDRDVGKTVLQKTCRPAKRPPGSAQLGGPSSQSFRICPGRQNRKRVRSSSALLRRAVLRFSTPGRKKTDRAVTLPQGLPDRRRVRLAKEGDRPTARRQKPTSPKAGPCRRQRCVASSRTYVGARRGGERSAPRKFPPEHRRIGSFRTPFVHEWRVGERWEKLRHAACLTRAGERENVSKVSAPLLKPTATREGSVGLSSQSQTTQT